MATQIRCGRCGETFFAPDSIGAPAATCPRCHAPAAGPQMERLDSRGFPGTEVSEINPYQSPLETTAGDPTAWPGGVPGRPSNALAWAALAIPVLAAVAECFVTLQAPAMTISIGAAVLSSLFVALDASRLSSRQPANMSEISPLALFLGGVLLWIVFFPLAFFRRRRMTSPNLAPLSLLVALLFVALPIAAPFVLPPELPECDSPEVKQLLNQIVADFPRVKQEDASEWHISGHREVSFDAEQQRRTGRCTLTIGDESIPLTFSVTWQDRAKALFWVKILEQ